MPAFIALATGAWKVVADGVLLMTQVAMPLAFAVMALLMALTMSVSAESVDPVHLGFGMPSSAAASAKPNWVGTKNRLVVTWLTNQNCHAGTCGKLPATAFAAEVDTLTVPVLLLFDEPHAASSAEAAAVALTRPVPASSLRRVGPSFMFSVCIASSTLGSTFLMSDLQLSPLKGTPSMHVNAHIARSG